MDNKAIIDELFNSGADQLREKLKHHSPTAPNTDLLHEILHAVRLKFINLITYFLAIFK
jgi:hypothetical protein